MTTDLNVIAENLTELLQNSVNMTSVFYDIFLNPEPMDVELKQFSYKGSFAGAYKQLASQISDVSIDSNTISFSGTQPPQTHDELLIKGTGVIDGTYIVTESSVYNNIVTVKLAQPIPSTYTGDANVSLRLGTVKAVNPTAKEISVVGSIIPAENDIIFLDGLNDSNVYTVVAASMHDGLVVIEVAESTLKEFNNVNKIGAVIIPNRAKDRRVALVGEGNPEGEVSANVGTLYVDISDMSAKTVYVKVTGTEATGWEPVLTQNTVESSLRQFMVTGKFINDSDVGNPYSIRTYLEPYVTKDELATDLAEYSPTTTMSDISDDPNIAFEVNKGYFLTKAGENLNFVLPPAVDVDRTILNKIFIQLNLTSGVPAGSTMSDVLGTSYFFECLTPDLSGAGMYNIIYEFDNNLGVWVCGVTVKGTAS